MSAIKIPKKLIEVALPLDDINDAAGKEKSIRHGHPSTLHLWWARRPLAAARAVIFAQLVNDPGYERALGRGVNKEKAKVERERLFSIIRRLVLWDNVNDEQLFSEARAEIERSWQETCELNRGHPDAKSLFDPHRLPEFHDPFAGGGAIPLEAQRLGLVSYASDLNPIPILLNKAMIDIPTRFSGMAPVGPLRSTDRQRKLTTDWGRARGLAEDVRRYGQWMRDRAFTKIGHLYPEADLPKNLGGGKAKVIAWLWARTVKSPNPAYSNVDVPLASSFVLSSKSGAESYLAPVIEGQSYRFEVKSGKPPESAKVGTKLARGANFKCLLSDTPITPEYIKSEGVAGRIGQRLLAVVVDAKGGRAYLSPSSEMEVLAFSEKAIWRPEVDLPNDPRNFWTLSYGLTKFSHLFTERQLIAINTYCDLIQEARQQIKADALKSGMTDDERGLEDGGSGATAYADAVAVYLGMALSRLTDICNSLCRWENTKTQVRNLFGRQSIPMMWDFAENNVFGEAAGDYLVSLNNLAKALDTLPGRGCGFAEQSDAQNQAISAGKVVSTDPPYYDNITYADLSDFFYVWLRKVLRPIYPGIFSTMTVPKQEELVATPYRHGSKEKAEEFFLNGMTLAMRQLSSQVHPAFPTTIYYAFKQADTTDVGTGNTGWETFLEAVLKAGFSIAGTWPMRTELANRMIGSGANALASSIVLVCKKREADAPAVSRRDFIRELKDELKEAVDVMIGGSEGVSPVAPVDLAQAVIGPGMAIFSKYSSVIEADGSPMTVHTALMLINRMLTEGADDFDSDTQFCLGWFDEQGWATGEFGQATVLARAKGTSVEHVKDAGVVEAASGKVRLLRPSEYPNDWAPENDNNTPVWEALHQLIRALRDSGESASGALLAGMPQRAEPIRSLAYRLYTLCERKGWADDARAYNELITSWTGIEAASHEKGHLGSQTKFDM